MLTFLELFVRAVPAVVKVSWSCVGPATAASFCIRVFEAGMVCRKVAVSRPGSQESG